jgi:hypothetical protein
MAVTYTTHSSIPKLDPEAVASYEDINAAFDAIDEVLAPQSLTGVVREITRFSAVLDADGWTADDDRFYIDVTNANITPTTDVEIFVDIAQAGTVPLLDTCTPLSGKVRVFASQEPSVDITITVAVREVLA